jgi:diguanylate cyclase (GGDEF)-like protein
LSDANLVLGQWSLGVHVAIVTLLAGFFLALTRVVRLHEVRLWALAWMADAAALLVLLVVTLFPTLVSVQRPALCVYLLGKAAYVLLLARGTANHLRPGSAEPFPPRMVLLAAVVWSAAVGMLAPTHEQVHVAVNLTVGAVLSTTAVWALRHPRTSRSRWLGIGLLVEGILFLHYLPLQAPVLWGARPLVAYVRYASFFNAGAELLVALVILVVMEGAASEHLHHLNRELEASQERLRQLVDLDPLTSLSNRRRLRAEFHRVRAQGAAVVFLDIDNFKEINDRHGHIAGDACLLRVATALARAFRNDDALFRLGGDEFLVVAPGLDPEGAERRASLLREAVALATPDGPPCFLSVGIAQLFPDGEPEMALREADDRMYLDKRRRKVAVAERSSDAARRLGGIPPING